MAKNILILLGILSFNWLHAQDTLPEFTVKNIGKNRVVISWLNQYPVVKQISIQRSFDSLKNFKTILSVTDPMARENGFADTRAPHDSMYYRLFISLDRGQFLFSSSKKPVLDTARRSGSAAAAVLPNNTEIGTPVNGVTDNKRHDLFIPSTRVFTNRDGYVRINLPDAAQKKYNLKFFEEDGEFLFDLKQISQPALTLDKSVFYYSGWFLFELYENDVLIEKHRFFIPPDF